MTQLKRLQPTICETIKEAGKEHPSLINEEEKTASSNINELTTQLISHHKTQAEI